MAGDVRTADLHLLLRVQGRLRAPVAVGAAHALGVAGDHAGAWIAAGAAGAVLDAPRRFRWLRATGVVVVAHAASVALKQAARRARPVHADLHVHRGRGGRWGMPSSHTASATAAAIVFGRLLQTRSTMVLPPAMALSRLVLGVHYPSDVVAGCAVGAIAALGLRR
ncbi:phosphatase PAP2 family protein [uncultured Cellulomonas sp.]|uniref:phosphatase PAP2 family protein n=1 Tax=uncultured Cellulomonas sp. TaxID=189682 RepID=UPI00262B75A0|nr:phosphatase PAP2 family protein [uncultured Cellulomonas sp.]